MIMTIDPGTLYWGVSVFSGRNLHALFLKNLSEKGSPENRLPKVRAIFLCLTRKYAPQVLIVKKPREAWKKQSRYLHKIIEEIKRLSQKGGIRVIEFSPKTIRKVLCQDEQATREDMAQAIGEFCPELKEYLNRDRKHKDKHWRKVGSLALGVGYLKIRNLQKSYRATRHQKRNDRK